MILIIVLSIILIGCGKPKPTETIESLKIQLEVKDKEINRLTMYIETTLNKQYLENRARETQLKYCRNLTDLMILSVEQDIPEKLSRTLGYAIAKAKVLVRHDFILDEESGYDEINELWLHLSGPKKEETEVNEEESIE